MPNEDMPTLAYAAASSRARTPIALVDDDVELRRQLQLLLRASNYDVRAYANAEALLADRGSQTMACLISDMHILDIDGFTLLRRLRAGGWSGPAILITSSRDAGLTARASSEGFHAVLLKPLADRVVLEAVKNAVNLDLSGQPAVAR